MKRLSSITMMFFFALSIFLVDACKIIKPPNNNDFCPPPTNVGLTGFEQLANDNYNLTYSWAPVPTAVSYKFTFYKNSEQVFSSDTESTTQLVPNIPVALYDTLQAEVAAFCENGQSSAATTTETVYMNAVTTDDIVYRASSNTKVNDICRSNCDHILFSDPQIKDNSGGILNINTVAVSIFVFYDHAYMKNCLCKTNNSFITPAVLNACMLACPKSIITDPKFCN